MFLNDAVTYHNSGAAAPQGPTSGTSGAICCAASGVADGRFRRHWCTLQVPLVRGWRTGGGASGALVARALGASGRAVKARLRHRC